MSTALPYKMSLPQHHLGTEDTLQVLQWQNVLVPALPSKMTGPEVSSQTNSLREISKYHYPCGTCFELEPAIGKSFVDHKVEELVELDDYDTECVSNTGWSELEY